MLRESAEFSKGWTEFSKDGQRENAIFCEKLLDEEKLPTKLLKFLAANYRRSVCAGSESLELRFAP